MQLLLIKLKQLEATPEYALLGKKQLEDRFTPADWKRVRSLTRGRRVVLLIPNADTTLTTVRIPSKNKKQLVQATPYALEDTLAEDIDDLHFSIHQENESKETHVAVINREILTKYLTLLKSSGINVHYILPQILTQPIAENGWSLIQNGNIVNVRLNSFNGFSANKDLLDILLSNQFEKQAPEKIITNIGVENLPQSIQDIPIEEAKPEIIYAKNIEPALALNLMTGFISKHKTSSGNIKAWKSTFVLATLVAGVGLGILTLQSNALKTQSNQLTQAIEGVFLSALPNSRIVDAPHQMKTKLNQLKKNAGKITNSPLPLIAAVSPVIRQFKGLTLSEIRYQDETLELVIQFPNLTRLEAFKTDARKKAQLNIKTKSSSTTADTVKAILEVSLLSDQQRKG